MLDHPGYGFRTRAVLALGHSTSLESDRLTAEAKATDDERAGRQVARVEAKEREERGPDDSDEVFIV